MTGEKNRYKTHEQLWKLEDGELSTPQHDELVLQLLNKNCVPFLFDALNIKSHYEIGYYTYKNDHWIYIFESYLERKYGTLSWGRKNVLNINELYDLVNEKYSLYHSELLQKMERSTPENNVCPIIRSEVPVLNGRNKFIIGYIDVQMKFPNLISHDVYIDYSKYPELESVLLEAKSKEYRSDELSIYTINLGFKEPGTIKLKHDLYVDHGYNGQEDTTTINIEVKPKIKSFGETLRQINTYRECDPTAIYMIYSPDTRFKAAFESQGVKLISPSELRMK